MGIKPGIRDSIVGAMRLSKKRIEEVIVLPQEVISSEIHSCVLLLRAALPTMEILLFRVRPGLWGAQKCKAVVGHCLRRDVSQAIDITPKAMTY